MTYRSVVITGASSGLGAALALACAAPGVTLHLCGRDAPRLGASAAACRARGAVVHAQVLDVADTTAMAGWIGGIGQIDLLVANAGISGGTSGLPGETTAQIRRIFAVNLDGVLNTVLPALPLLAAQAPGSDGVRGRVAVVASIAAFVPAPSAPSYCASKAAVDTWAVASAAGLARQGIVMSSICPGYVESAITAANRFPMPGLMPADRAAGIILRGIAKGRRRIAFPWWMAAAARLTGLLAPRLLARLLATQPDKDALPLGEPPAGA